ncbi:hypothetical protein QBC47DRAFT_429294 [Echria macrotheca]|uniref:Uncharacterized protein n=1 Tax=Echria macrotheca TaxID=438768 RepID=A0AAJ0B9U4_9PEZI|nr:hypothetical protein QBC47DRAFT_429294 [Echria macrotheca]
MALESLFGDRFDKTNLSIGIAAAFFTVLLPFFGYLIGIAKSKFDYAHQRSISFLGSICMNELQMGPFVSRDPISRKYYVCPFRKFPIARPPTLPTVASLIAAGDDGVWSSDIFNKRIPPNHDTVSWKRFYEAFFYECVARVHLPDLPKDSAVRSALSAARKEFPSADDQLYLGRVSQENVHQRAAEPGAVEREAGRITKCRPLLVRCQKLPPMKTLSADGTTYGDTADEELPEPSQSWAKDVREVWIHAGKPSIEVLKEELVALSLIIGFPLDVHDDFLPGGRGPYGITLTSEKIEAVTTIRLVHGPRIGSTGGPKCLAKGSGYSTLFAKHMACGSLPFAQYMRHSSENNNEPSTRETQSIMVTEKVRQSLEGGGSITNAQPDKGDNPRELNYFLRLPGSGDTDFYLNSETPTGYNPGAFGQGRLVKSHPDNDKKFAAISTWWQAVAGIPFGGLVSLTTQNLREMVIFTLKGSLQCPGSVAEIDPILELMRIADRNAQKEDKISGLFGDLPGSGAGIVHTTDMEDNDPRFATDTISYLMTLLEHMMALAAVHEKHSSDPEVTTKAVCDALEDWLMNSYNAAVSRKLNDPIQGPTESFSGWIDNGEHGLIAKVWSRKVTAEDCAKAAICILAAWTCLVKIVNWTVRGNEATQNPPPAPALGAAEEAPAPIPPDDAEEPAGLAPGAAEEAPAPAPVADQPAPGAPAPPVAPAAGAAARASEDKAESYYPPLLRKLPDVSAWS